MRIAKLTLGIFLGASIALGTTRLIGKSLAQYEQFGFNPSNCNLPCLVGITPGKTPYSQIGPIIDSLAPQIKTDAWGPYFTDSQGTEIHIQLGDSSNNLETVPLLRVSVSNPCCKPPHELTTLGELISIGYMPARVFRVDYTGPNTVVLYIVFNSNPTLIAEVVGYKQLTPQSPVTDLIEDANSSYTTQELLGYYHIHAKEIGWYGFTSTDRYLNASTIN